MQQFQSNCFEKNSENTFRNAYSLHPKTKYFLSDEYFEHLQRKMKKIKIAGEEDELDAKEVKSSLISKKE